MSGCECAQADMSTCSVYQDNTAMPAATILHTPTQHRKSTVETYGLSVPAGFLVRERGGAQSPQAALGCPESMSKQACYFSIRSPGMCCRDQLGELRASYEQTTCSRWQSGDLASQNQAPWGYGSPEVPRLPSMGPLNATAPREGSPLSLNTQGSEPIPGGRDRTKCHAPLLPSSITGRHLAP